jgi:hypothetical protein
MPLDQSYELCESAEVTVALVASFNLSESVSMLADWEGSSSCQLTTGRL